MPSLRSAIVSFLVLMAFAAVAPTRAAEPADSALGVGGFDFLPVDEAFRLGVDAAAEPLRVFWQIEPGYYLYRHRLSFELQRGGQLASDAVAIPPGKEKQDEYFGDVEVYYGDLAVTVALPPSLPADAVLAVGYQGCADAGLCYPPEKRYVALGGAAVGSIGERPPAAPAAAPVEATAETRTTTASAAPVTEEGRLAALLGGDDLLLALGIFLLAGIGLAFTPCVLPMVPILSSIIAGQGAVSRARAATLSGTYVLAMAVTYAVLGTVVGFFGGALNIHGWLQSPPVLVVFAGLFAVLSLAMFGFYELQLPAFLRSRLEGRGGGGSLGSVAAMGVFSSLLVSPCVSAPLAGALVYISSTGDALLGGSALFALALGMGVPLMVVGVGGGALLPQAGVWMNAVKAVFGVLLLGVSVWLLERVLPAGVTLLLWAALAVGSGVALGALDFERREGLGNLWKASGAMLFVYGVVLIVGAASGAHDPLRPLAPLAASAGAPAGEAAPSFRPVDTLADVEASLSSARATGRPVLLDLYADWCISCKVMERSVFPEPEVQRLMAEFDLLRADVTANDAEHRALLAHYDLFGPPSLLFFDPVAGELRAFRLQGEIGSAAFADHLRQVLATSG
ncbi:MAG: protein-disulfide reductase DsbD [Pseudomonadales bacterium]|jgi:thiol:disulfide interchange protein DsbD|nr:protein-disulfide reductase DsbD [Pseudomonadales bacterium]